MKKRSVFAALALIFIFSTQLSFGMECVMDCLNWICSCGTVGSQYNSIPQEAPKLITPIEAHYNAIMEIVPKIKQWGDMADAVAIVNNAKARFNIKEHDFGLFAFKQSHSKNYNKGASLLIALIEQYNKEIEGQNMPALTRLGLQINGQVYNTPTYFYTDSYEDLLFLKSIGLEKSTKTQMVEYSARKLAISIGLLSERFNQWDGMATALYGNTKDSNESTTSDEDSLH
jgi:hypothetical protein